jgi:hypothetical protein
MRFPAILLLCGFSAAASLYAQDDSQPTLSGYVTRVGPNADFDVNGTRILCAEKALTRPKRGQSVNLDTHCAKSNLFLGEPADIYGAELSKDHAVYATRIVMKTMNLGKVAGLGVIEAQPSTNNAIHDLMVRADGYRILIGSSAKITWTAPLQTFSDVKAGDWIVYQGKLNDAGIVIAKLAKFAPDALNPQEQKLRQKQDFDPAAVPDSAKQSFMSVSLKGADPKLYPPYKDPAMQARVEEIGRTLIPAFQRELPENDPAKIHFRFQLIDTENFREALALSSGIVLVPHQVVERMQNDSQFAEVIADGIACTIEGQNYHGLRKVRSLKTEALAFGAAGAFVPAAGLAEWGTWQGATDLQLRLEEQRGRVSLSLLHDAGYDIDQAPLAWWLLDPKKPKPVAEIDMPERVGVLYKILGEQWHNPAIP